MKTFSITVILSFLGSVGLLAQSNVKQTSNVPEPTAHRIVDRGANHRVWKWETFEISPTGQVVSREHSYTELATGMHYKDANGQWQESQELIESFPGGAVARQGQYQVIFANNLNSYGAIDMHTQDGKRLRSNILGLMYVDTESGEGAFIAQIQDSTGELIANNQVLYPNAFEGVKADVRYTYKRGSFEQDVILREQPPSPESYGLNPKTTVLEVVTEFLNPPTATISEVSNAASDDVDQTINWGGTQIGRGNAFELNAQKTMPTRDWVKKRYFNVGGRNYLIERVKMKDIRNQLDNLPLQSSIDTGLPKMASKQPEFPKSPAAKHDVSTRMKLAVITSSDKGYVLDYVAINAAQTNYTFKGDATYYVSGGYTLYGTTTIEGGAVIKMNDSGQINIVESGDLVCQTASYRPAIFTSKNDNTVGETISGSSGNPTFYDVNCYLNVCPTNAVISDLRFSHAVYPLEVSSSLWTSMLDIWNCQFVDFDYAMFVNSVGLHNVLFVRVNEAASWPDPAVYAQGPVIIAENVTAHGGDSFVCPAYGDVSMGFTNCLITGQPLITSGYPQIPQTNSVMVLTNVTSPVYQAVGGGGYYLTNGSPYRDIGTTNINPVLLVQLMNKTTYPPMVYSNTTISVATNLSPRAQRDTDVPDLGYHYDPLDYAFNMTSVSSNITFAAGTAVAWFSKKTSSSPGWGVGDPWGLGLANDVMATFSGTAANPCSFVVFNAVQECNDSSWMWAYVGGICAVSSYNSSHFPTMKANFTLISHPSGVASHFRDYNNGLIVSAKNSEIYGNCGGYDIELWLTNCLIFRNNYWQGTADPAYAWELYRNIYQNCTFYGGSVEYVHWEGSPYWKVLMKNCAFDGTTLKLYNAGGGMSWLTSDYNATNTTMSYGGNPLFGGSNVSISGAYNWQSSWLGDYYLPTNSLLINAGSTTADQLALYHFTTQTNQTKETNSPVDIGYHYVTIDEYGNPVDSDGDGVADYLEDVNGNGIFDAGDLSEWLISPFNGISITNGLKVFTPLK